MTLSKRARRLLVVALTLGFVAAPSLALAQPGPAPEKPGAYGPAGPGKKGPKAQRKRPRFPMEGDRFMARVNERIKKVKARLDAAMKKRNVPPKLAAEIHADFAKASTAITQAAQKAAADGQVTRQEAQKVRQLAKKMRQQARKKYGKIIREQRKGKRGKQARGQRGQRAPRNF